MYNNLVVGYKGEVGSAIYNVFYTHYKIDGIDMGDVASGYYDVMHVCIPYSNDFVNIVKDYQKKYRPKYTIIHSTVPIGTSKKVGAIHSPVRGFHPNLELSLHVFVKFIGGEQASMVADLFRKVGIKVCLFDKPETTEAMKLFDTEYYRTCIEFTKKVKMFCDNNELNFHEVYTLANQTYNEGYQALGYPEFTRPVLQAIMGSVGGHCLIPNSRMIDYEHRGTKNKKRVEEITKEKATG